MNCKPGDLAIVVNSQFEENLGVLVEVTGPPEHFIHTTDWHVRSAGLRPIVGTNQFGRMEACTEADVADVCLRPIRGEPESAVDEIRELAPHELEGVAIWPA